MARLLGTISTLRWQTRIKLWLAALLAGLMVVAFAKLADMALGFFAYLTSGRAWVPLILTPTVGMFTVWLTRRFCPGAEGSGIPQVIAATWLAAKGKPVNTLLSLRIAFGKIFLGALAQAVGFVAVGDQDFVTFAEQRRAFQQRGIHGRERRVYRLFGGQQRRGFHGFSLK